MLNFDSSNYFHVGTLVQGALFAVHLYLRHRQTASFHTKTIPPALAEIPADVVDAAAAAAAAAAADADLPQVLTQEQFDKTQAYGHAKSAFELVSMAAKFAIKLAQFRWGARMWYWTLDAIRACSDAGWMPKRLQDSAAAVEEGGVAHAVATQAVAGGLETLAELPLKIVYHFVLEEKFGFNRLTPAEFIKDTLKVFALKAFVLAPIQTLLINGAVRRFGKNFPAYLAAAASATLVAATFVIPTVIMPMFYEFTHIENYAKDPARGAALKTAIDKLAERFSFPCKKIFVMDGSRKSAHSNAFMFGFGQNKRIVLFDTLLTHLRDSEILAVLCHEIGHWYHSHTLKFMFASMLQILAMCFGAREILFDKKAYADFGFDRTTTQSALPPLIGFDIFMELAEPAFTVLGWLLVVVSRRFEYQADQYAIDAGAGPQLFTGLLRMQQENLACITPDPVFSALHASHPILPERLAFIVEATRAHNSSKQK